MAVISPIICKTIGAAGIAAALYDTVKVSNHFAAAGKEDAAADYYQKLYADTRTIDNISYVSNAAQNKITDLREKNPLPVIWGSIKGWTKGALYTLCNWLPAAGCASLALLTKGFLSKLGAAGVVLCSIYNIAHNGFDVGKNNPMD